MEDYNGQLVAVLTCTAGEVMEQSARNSLLESFGYERANDSLPNLWMPMTGDGDNDCAVEVSDDGRIVRLFGDNDENIANLNGILRRIGWDDYDAQVIDNVIERRITHALASVLMRKCEPLKDVLSIDDMFAQFAPSDDEHTDTQISSDSTDLPVDSASASVVTNMVALEEERDGLISDLENIKRERDTFADKYARSEKEVTRLEALVEQLRQNLASAQAQPAPIATSADLPPEVVREALTVLLSREVDEHLKGSRWAQALKSLGVLPRLQLADSK